MAIDSSKRTTLKALTAATGAMAIPSIASAAYAGSNASTDKSITGHALNTDLVVSFSDKQGINGVREVIVTNTSRKPVTLSLVYPSVVSTPEGQYDLNSLLINGTRTFAPKQAIKLNINPATRAASNTRTPWMHPADSMISVLTHNPNINGGAPVTTTRAMFS